MHPQRQFRYRYSTLFVFLSFFVKVLNSSDIQTIYHPYVFEECYLKNSMAKCLVTMTCMVHDFELEYFSKNDQTVSDLCGDDLDPTVIPERLCGCDSLCKFYDDCCFDYHSVCESKKDEPSQDRVNEKIPKADVGRVSYGTKYKGRREDKGNVECVGGYRLVASCPDDQILKEGIQQSYDDVKKTFITHSYNFVVSDPVEGISYTNISVFECNNVYDIEQRSRILVWEKLFERKATLKKLNRLGPSPKNIIGDLHSGLLVNNDNWRHKDVPPESLRRPRICPVFDIIYYDKFGKRRSGTSTSKEIFEFCFLILRQNNNQGDMSKIVTDNRIQDLEKNDTVCNVEVGVSGGHGSKTSFTGDFAFRLKDSAQGLAMTRLHGFRHTRSSWDRAVCTMPDCGGGQCDVRACARSCLCVCMCTRARVCVCVCVCVCVYL